MCELGKFSGVLYFLRSLQNYELYKFNGKKVSLNELKFDENLSLDESINSHENTLILSDGLFENVGMPKADYALSFGEDSDEIMLSKVAKRVLSIDLALQLLMDENEI